MIYVLNVCFKADVVMLVKSESRNGREKILGMNALTLSFEIEGNS